MDRELAERLAEQIAEALVDREIVELENKWQAKTVANYVLYNELVKPEEKALYEMIEKQAKK